MAPPDPYRYFRIEGRELVDQLGKGVLDLERGGGVDLVARLLRLAHTLKGAARVVKQREIADGAHAIEEALAPLRDGAAADRDRIEQLLRVVDDIGTHLEALAPPPEVSSASAAIPAPETPRRDARADLADLDAVLDGVTETHTQLAALRVHLGELARASRVADLLVGQVARHRGAGDVAAAARTSALADELGRVCGGLERAMTGTVDQMDRELRAVRDAAEQLRLVPASALFTVLERTARDAARALGKDATFEGRGGDVRIDAQVLVAAQTALVQMVRNAVAHGIEPEAERRRTGKPAAGRIAVEIARRGRRVLITCRDDGRGVDLEAVRRAAVRRGVPADQARGLDAEALVGLLLRGGITTAATVTEVAGRGVGLDVVREATEGLGGTVTVRTVAGGGTTVELSMPLSLAAVEGLVVDSSGQATIIPLDAIRRTLRIAADDVTRGSHGDAIVYAGEVIPFAPLRRALRLAAPTGLTERAWAVVVLEGATGLAAVGVDRTIGTATAVLRPLPASAPADAVIAGVALDAEGNPQLVLDPDHLVAATRAGFPLEISTPRERRPLLVVDDSLTTRMLEQSILESAGYEVDLACSGEQGLEAVRRRSYALILCDVEMPGIDGFTVVERLRADPATRDIPAILVTSRASADDRQRGLDVGAKGYVIKGDFDQGAVLEMIDRLIRGRT